MRHYEEKWMVRNKPGNVAELVDVFGITPAFARLLWNRGLCSVEQVSNYLHPDSGMLPKGESLPDAQLFYRILKKKQASNAKIRVIGDYDVDGVTATYVMLDALSKLGISADYRIPDRVADGYGISNAMVEECVRDGIDTVITVDNGIAANEQIALAKQYGLTVLVTDHHEPQEELPSADAIVNPKRKDASPVMSNLCGAVVAGLLMDMVLSLEGMPGYFMHQIEIMALATVCDVMDLSGESRTIVRCALNKPVDRWNFGLRTLIEVCGLSNDVRVYTLGFVIGPCINALGRMETADAGVELLLTEDVAQANAYSERMVAVNEVRKEQTEHNLKKAFEMIRELGEQPDDVLVVPIPDCHESLAGIIAGRIREQYHRPTIVITKTDSPDGIWKGSARSIEAYSIFDGLTHCSEHLLKFGGHAMAAGLTVSEDEIAALRQMLNDDFRESGASVVKTMHIDLVMSLSQLSMPFVQELSMMEPLGKGNAKPLLATRAVTLVRMSYIGRVKKYLRFVLRDADGVSFTALWFRDADELVDEFRCAWGEEACKEAFAGRGTRQMNILYSAEISEYRNVKEVQLFLESMQLL